MHQESGRPLDSSPNESNRRIDFLISTGIESEEEIENKILETTKRADEVAEAIAVLLEGRGWRSADREHDIGAYPPLKDTLDNAIFHGNFGIGKLDPAKDFLPQVKQAILEKMRSGGKIPGSVNIKIDPGDRRIIIIIQDGGMGFDWRAIQDPTDKQNLLVGTGRGIFMLKNAFGKDNVRFNDAGNQVTISADIPQKK